MIHLYIAEATQTDRALVRTYKTQHCSPRLELSAHLQHKADLIGAIIARVPPTDTGVTSMARRRISRIR